MILFVTASDRAAECAAGLQTTVGERIRVESAMRPALAAAREQDYSVLVLDELFLECDPRGSQQLLQLAGSALPVTVNLAVSGPERLLRAVQSARQRQQRERKAVETAARAELWKRVGGDLTGILMAAELALQVPQLSSDLRTRLGSIQQLAGRMRDALRR